LHYTKDSLNKYFETPIQKKVSLKNPLPILIRYYTAEVDSSGLKLYIDIYNKDESILKMLYPLN
jgi:murein L,D-transpeptidase YcbB/YkuD